MDNISQKLSGFVNSLNNNNITKLSVAGSREWTDCETVHKYLEFIIANSKVDTIVSGGAHGPDKFAEDFADSKGLTKIIHLAEWDKFGKSAGPRRNSLIAQDGEALLAFVTGNSNGTRNTIQHVSSMKKPMFIVEVLW